MASNLSTIGFQFADELQFRESMVSCAAAASDQLTCPAGHYGIWRSRSGAEIWFHLGRTHEGEIEIFGLTPFFEGKSEVKLAISRALHRDGDNGFEGALQGTLNPQETGGGGSYPIVFEAVDFALTGAQSFPVTQRVRLAAFARELTAYANEDAYYAAHEGSDRPVFAAVSFIPVGLFASEQSEEGSGTAEHLAVPPSTAIFTGRVLEHSSLVNEATGKSFEWVLVETLDATLDVVADPSIIVGPLAEGATVSVSALIFGRVLG